MEAIELNVGGMHCDGCERSIARALERIAGVLAVTADHKTGKVVVDAERAIDRSEFERAVDDAGYLLVPAGSQGLPTI